MTDLIWETIDERAVDTVRTLAADAVEKAGSGHPGTAISLAPLAYLLYQRILRRDPADPHWVGRDRFILSAGHSSLTQYIQLYLAGDGLELSDLQELRTWGSKTPGHPEYGHTDGIEMTTGPLGQGLASSVGFAYAARFERGLFDPEAAPGESPFDHRIYVIASDGDIEEGVTSEAGSLAGTQELGNLIVFYDSNQISIEDDTNIALSEDTAARYEAYGWHVQTIDWNTKAGYHEDVHRLHDAIEAAQKATSQPSLIVLKTIIGWPSPTKQNTGKIHGSAMGDAEVRGLKEAVGADPDATFAVADDVIAHTREALERGRAERAEWQTGFDAWAAANPERKALFDRLAAGEVPDGLESALPEFPVGKDVSTRVASGKVINAISEVMPEFWGGSADLAESNNTTIEDAESFGPAIRSTGMWSAGPYGRVLHFGIREHAMGSILSGIVLHGPTRAFGATFLIFSDYMRPAVRLASLMRIPTLYVWTHDSVALGGDGPTHQPIEQLTALRAIPNFEVIRPADANETAWAWKTMLERRRDPAGIVLSRQNLPVYARGDGDASGDTLAHARATAKGGYVLAEAPGGTPDVVLIATGSEVKLAVEARAALRDDGVNARVVSMPSQEWFDEQDAAYRDAVLPPTLTARVSIEAGLRLTWLPYLGDAGRSVSIEHYGASADGDLVYARLGMTVEAVVAAAHETIAAAAS